MAIRNELISGQETTANRKYEAVAGDGYGMETMRRHNAIEGQRRNFVATVSSTGCWPTRSLATCDCWQPFDSRTGGRKLIIGKVVKGSDVLDWDIDKRLKELEECTSDGVSAKPNTSTPRVANNSIANTVWLHTTILLRLECGISIKNSNHLRSQI
jgi:hypothetical protein